MTFVTRGGKILIVNGALTNNPECCCECTCCDFDAATAALVRVVLEWAGPNGNSSGNLVPGSVVATAVTTGEDGCVGKFEFDMLYSNGACQASDIQPAYATLHQATGPNGTCCFWKVYFSGQPYAVCADGITNLNAGWPGPGPALVPTCAGLATDVPDGCPQQTTDPCYPYCDTGGFSFVEYETNLAGDCFCPGDPTNSGGGSGGGSGSDEGFP